MANAKVDVVGQDNIPVVVELYNRIYRPTHDVQFFRRRFLGRYNVLMLVATLDEVPVGFFIGFELKPTVFFAWLYGVMPDVRRQGIASQLMDAAHSWRWPISTRPSASSATTSTDPCCNWPSAASTTSWAFAGTRTGARTW